jgi:ubiquinone/menaquinone biosynthesis C-methylase UbiE
MQAWISILTESLMQEEKRPPVCDYEGSDYQTRFWEKGGRDYEDRCEAIALKRLLPSNGSLMLELGAGAGRNTMRYRGFERVVLLDYSRTQLKQAQERLGASERYIYVAADIYRLPFMDGLFDAATMIRTLHHMADAPAALSQVRNVLQPGATFILEYANKRNLKAILRYAFHRQPWSPFGLDPVEFAPLNFDFHPHAIRHWLETVGFKIESILAVSHFRIEFLKRNISPGILSGLDSLLQWTGALWQVTPSVFIKSTLGGFHFGATPSNPMEFFKCPDCSHSPLVDGGDHITCPVCNHQWNIMDGIYDFRGE